VVEDLNVKGMQKTDLAKPVSDSGFGTFVDIWNTKQIGMVDSL
jgi:hypothetical protein